MKIKIFAVSDLHLSAKADKPMDIFGEPWQGHLQKIRNDWSERVAQDDIVLHAGDFSWAMTLEEALFDFAQISDLPGTKVMIKGNHDYWWSSISRLRAALPPDIIALQNDAVRLCGAVICGSRGWSVPGMPDFSAADEKIYLRETERFKMSLAAAAKLRQEGDVLICMSHFPPFNARRDGSLFTELFEKYSVDKVVYGHLHGSDSYTKAQINKGGVEYLLTSCDKLNFKLARII